MNLDVGVKNQMIGAVKKQKKFKKVSTCNSSKCICECDKACNIGECFHIKTCLCKKRLFG